MFFNYIITLMLCTISHLIQAHQLIGGQSSPQFIVEPPTKVHFSNSSGAVIPCTATGYPSVKTWWVSSDESIVNDVPGLRHIRSTGELVLSPFSAQIYTQDVHSTTYRCIASNGLGTIKSRDCEVRAVVHQHYKVQVYDEFVITGNTAVLRCQVPTFVKEYVNVIGWIKGDQVIASLTTPKVGSRYSILSTGELLIRNSSKHDSGHYRCQTRHQLTHDVITSSNPGQLTVTDPHGPIVPRIWTHAQVKVVKGESLELVCVAQSWPAASYRWYKEDEETGFISVVPVQFNSHIITSSNEIVVINHADVNHQGKWLCSANNSVGEERISIRVYVIEPMQVNIEPAKLIVDIGKPATFNCTVRGNPINYPLVWYKNGKLLVNDVYGGVLSMNSKIVPEKVISFHHNLLNIKSVSREDAGSYQCFAQSDYETAQATAELKLGDTPPVITETFKSGITIEPGTSLSLKCSASASPLPQIRWYIDDINISLGHISRHQIGDFVTQQGRVVSFVNISSIRVIDGGEYKCVAYNNVGEASFSGQINVIGGPMIRNYGSSVTNITCIAGRSAYLRCPIIGYPIDSLIWQYNGVTLPVNHRQKVEPLFNGIPGKLHINNVHRNSDQGEYQCVVKGLNGKTVKTSVYLTVKVAPLIDSQPLAEKTYANQGMKVKLMCSILEGDPPIEIRWFKGSSSSPVVSTHNILLQNSDDYSLLTFKNVQHKDMGNWTCKAWNEVETATRSTFLVVHVSPSWLIEPKNTFVVIGQTAAIDCSAEGSPSPRISWKKASIISPVENNGVGDDNERESPSDFREILSSYRHQIYVNGTIVLQEVDKNDAGFYMCQVSNDIGAGLSKVIQLTVQIPPFFETKFISKTVTKGDTALLQCEAQGDQIIKIVWQKDKQTIDFKTDKRYSFKDEPVSSTKMISIFEITSTNRHDSALYTCIASNEFGVDDTNIQLIVQEVPEPPHALTIEDVTSRSATISWKSSFSGNSAVNRYIIQYKDENCTKITNQQDNDDGKWKESFERETKHVLRMLIPTCKYQLRILAENSIGKSVPSSIITFKTGEEVPGGPPIDIVIEPTSSTSMKIRWKPPKKEVQFGRIKGYYIGYKISESDDPFQYKNVEAVNIDDNDKYEMSYVTNLKRKTNYIIILQAYNSIGAGPRSDEIQISTFDSQPPTSPLLEVVSTSSDSITLRWDLNSDEIDEREYLLHFKEDQKIDWHTKKIRTRQNQFVLDSTNGLAPIKCGTKYKLFMTAINSLGSGEPSETINTKTRGAPPLSPASSSEFIIPNVTSAVIKLSDWQSNGCPVIGFTIKYKPVYQKQWIVLGESVNYNQPNYVINNLASNREYKLFIAAHSDAGMTEAEYNFRTLNNSLVLTVRQSSSQDMSSSRHQSSLSIFSDITVLLPVIISVVVLIAVLGTLLGCMRRQQVDQVAVNCNDSQYEQQKSEVSLTNRSNSESFALNDFPCDSKPKYFDSQLTPTPKSSIVPKKFSNANLTSYYSSPIRKPSMLGQHNHEYAEPCQQQLMQQNCCSFDKFNSCNLNQPSQSLMSQEKIYSTIKRPFL